MITQARALEVFDYNATTGELTRKVSRSRFGKITGATEAHGYKRAQVDGKKYLTHRLIFLMHHGYMPEYVDHINRDKTDNRIENLRACTKAQNEYNRPARARSTTGVKNVTRGYGGKFVVAVRVNGRKRNFGTYEDIELAELVAREVSAKYHGEFAVKEV